jgi:hypothetical protein
MVGRQGHRLSGSVESAAHRTMIVTSQIGAQARSRPGREARPPKIDRATERKVRKQLAKGVGILKVAKSLGVGTGRFSASQTSLGEGRRYLLALRTEQNASGRADPPPPLWNLIIVDKRASPRGASRPRSTGRGVRTRKHERRLMERMSVQDGLILIRDPVVTYVLPANSPWLA